jgi:hypothetical protein
MAGDYGHIGDAMVALAAIAALCAPISVATVVALPLLIWVSLTAACIAWGIGAIVGIVALCFILREAR